MTNEEAINHVTCGRILNDEQKDRELRNFILDSLERSEKYKWHDLRKNPEDLPKEDDKRYLMYYCGSCVTACGSFIKNFEYAVGWREIEPFEEDV